MFVRNRIVSPRGWPNQVCSRAHAVIARPAAPEPQTSSGHQIVPFRYSTPGCGPRPGTSAHRGRRSRNAGATMNAGAIARLVPVMLPTISPRPRRRASSTISSASVRPPHLSSLMLSTWKRPTRPATSPSPSALSSAASGIGLIVIRRGPLRGRAPAVARAARPSARTIASTRRSSSAIDEALVCVDAEPDVRARVANCRNARDVEIQFAGQFDLDGVRIGIVARGLRHLRGSSAPTVKVVTSGRTRVEPSQFPGRLDRRAKLRAPTSRNRRRCARRRPAGSARSSSRLSQFSIASRCCLELLRSCARCRRRDNKCRPPPRGPRCSPSSA